MKKRVIQILFLLCLLIVDVAPLKARGDDNSLELAAGEQKVLSIPGVTRVSIGQRDIIDVRAIGSNQILITALKPGKSSLLVWLAGGRTKRYTVKVVSATLSSVARDISKLLAGMEGVEINIVGDKIFLDGYTYTSNDYKRVQEIAKIYNNVISLVRPNPKTAELEAKQLDQMLKNAGFATVYARPFGDKIVIEGGVSSNEEKKKIDVLASSLGDMVENLVTVGYKRMILAEVKFMEVSKSTLDKIGIQWPAGIVGTADVNYKLTKVFYGTGTDESQLKINPQGSTDIGINLSANKGAIRVLAEPKLVCASGDKAEFLAGGEVPIPIKTLDSIYVEWKKYGIKLVLEPKADNFGNIQLKIETEVSDIDQSTSVMGYPGFITRRASTTVTVQHGETIVLSGLISNKKMKDVTKLAFLGHIPIIGELFKSRTFKEGRTDLAIFVTPRIVTTDTVELKRMIKDLRKRYEEAKKAVNFSIFD